MSFPIHRAWSLLPFAVLLACGASSADKSPEVLFADVSAPAVVTSARATMGRPLPTPTADLHAIWGADARHMFAVGDRGTVMHGDGERFQAFQIASNDNLHSVHGADEAHVWAVGGRNIARFDGKGWSVTKLDTNEGSATFLRIWGAPSGDMFVSNTESFVYAGTAGAWVEAHSGNPSDTRAVIGMWGTSRDDVILIEAGVTSYVYARHGLRETSCAVQNQTITGVWGSDITNVWAVGHGGFVGKIDQKSLETDMSDCVMNSPKR